MNFKAIGQARRKQFGSGAALCNQNSAGGDGSAAVGPGQSPGGGSEGKAHKSTENFAY